MAYPQRVPLRRVIEHVGISTEQSVAVVTEVAKHLHEWATLGRPRDLLVPGIRDLRLERGGAVSWHGGHTVPARAAVPAIGPLLTALLRHHGGRISIPAGLMYILVRATHDPSLAPFTGLEELIAALGRYGPLSTAAAIDALVAKYTIARTGLPPIGHASTVSDVRRLRRAGGVALATIASDTGIPLSLLRELEWGVYINWPELYADASIRAYALRAGLDPDVTLSVITRERVLSDQPPVAARPSRVPAERPILPQRLLPWTAIAALALGALFVGAGDRSPQASIAPMPSHTAAAPAPPATTESQAPSPSAQPEPSAITHPAPQAVPATPKSQRPPKPARVTNRSSSSLAAHRQTQQVARFAHPLMRLARAFAGNGKYVVQPFPKAGQER